MALPFSLPLNQGGGYNAGTVTPIILGAAVERKGTTFTGGGGGGKSLSFLTSFSCSGSPHVFPVWGRKWKLLFLWILIYIYIYFFTFLAWVLPVPAKSCFLLCQGDIPGPEGVGFVQLVAMSQCTETDLGGLAIQLPQSTQHELCPILEFPLRAILPQRMASLSHKSF